ncbi:hypothetical protein ASG99_10405 [Bacillus sp. Soil768D1]|nr:hypothetical protein ASG99_10405 [Bacillus sp. Soil768D1]
MIAGEVVFSLDIRHHQETILDSFCKEIFSNFDSFAEESEIKLEISQWMDVKPVEMDVEMNHLVREIADEKNISYQDIVSGAGQCTGIWNNVPNLLAVCSESGGNQPLT